MLYEDISRILELTESKPRLGEDCWELLKRQSVVTTAKSKDVSADSVCWYLPVMLCNCWLCLEAASSICCLYYYLLFQLEYLLLVKLLMVSVSAGHIYGYDILAGFIYSNDRVVSYLMLITINNLGRDLFLSLTRFTFSCLAI